MFGVIPGHLTELIWELALLLVCLGPFGVTWAPKSPQTQDWSQATLGLEETLSDTANPALGLLGYSWALRFVGGLTQDTSGSYTSSKPNSAGQPQAGIGKPAWESRRVHSLRWFPDRPSPRRGGGGWFFLLCCAFGGLGRSWFSLEKL